jgi:hypothetical protein
MASDNDVIFEEEDQDDQSKMNQSECSRDNT